MPGFPVSTSQGLANKLMPPQLARNFISISTVSMARPSVLSWDVLKLILPSFTPARGLAVETGLCWMARLISNPS